MRGKRFWAVLLTGLCAASITAGIEGWVLLPALVLAVLCVWLVSELAVEGFEGVCLGLGLSVYVAGVASSFASNLPEVVLACLTALSPHLREVAAVMVVLAAAFNSVLLGLLIIFVSWDRGYIAVPSAALTVEAEAMRMGAVMSTLYALVGLLVKSTGGATPTLPREAAVFPLVAYAVYALLLQRRESVERRDVRMGRAFADALIGVLGIFVSSEVISRAAEAWVADAGLNPVFAATILAFTASVPEHAVAIVGARKGKLEMGLSNLISGIVQSILLVFPLVALISLVVLDGFVIYQLIASAAILWLVEKAITDDKRLTLDEGVFMVLTSVLGILLLDELSLMI